MRPSYAAAVPTEVSISPAMVEDAGEVLRADGQEPAHVEAQATLALAIVRGLLLDQKATGEGARFRSAYQALRDL